MLPRVLTALVGLPVLAAAIWYGSPWLTLLVLTTAALGVGEFYRLTPPGVGPLSAGLGTLWVAAMVLGAQATGSAGGFLLVSAIVWAAGAFVALLWLIGLYREPVASDQRSVNGHRAPAAGHWLLATAWLLAGPLYVGFLLSHALPLREVGQATDGAGDMGRLWLLLTVLVTFAADTGAFLVGRTVGHRVIKSGMAPRISPAKTWEGAVGGFVAAVAAAVALGLLFGLDVLWWQAAVIGATVGIVAQCGDLLESALKRMSNVKDAGSIIPGHGGILDRLDSIVFSLPAVYYLVTIAFGV